MIVGIASGSPAVSEDAALNWSPTSTRSMSASPWQFSGAIYAWLPNAPADITVGGRTFTFDENIDTILDSALLAFEGELSARKGPLGLFFAAIYYEGEYDDTAIGPLGITRQNELEEKAWLVNYGLSYEIGTLSFGGAPDATRVAVSPFVGGTYFHDEVSLTVTPGFLSPQFDFDTTVEFHTPVVGLDTLWSFSDKWGGRIRAHYGGFGGIDGVEDTWEVIAGLTYATEAWGRNGRWYAGWRHTDIDYRSGAADLALEISGPFFGYEVDF